MDLDETMTTSTSSSPSASAIQEPLDADETFEDDNLFPDSLGGGGVGDRPQTPANDHLNAAAPGELSPPRSQTQSDEATIGGQALPNGRHGAAANISATRSSARGMGLRGIEAAFEAQQDESVAFPALSERDERPGWGWKNKKAQEDMQRAWENVVDRDFSLKEYGDVVMLGRAQLEQR